MLLPTRLLRLTEQDIKDLVGPAAFGRGASYHRMARATSLTWDDREECLTAAVRGSGNATYRTDVYLLDPRHPEVVEFTECSCPVGGYCKHVAALLLTARARVARAAAQNPGTSPGRTAPPAAWKLRLNDLHRAAEHAARPPLGLETTPLALQFRVEGESAAERRYGRAISLAVRPVTRNARGTWVSGNGVSWEVLAANRPFAINADPQTRQWFAELAALRRDDYYGSSAWTDTGQFVPRLFLPHLVRGVDLGVPFVGTAARDRIAVGQAASVELTATRGERGLTLRPRVVVDGVEQEPGTVGAVGRGGVFTFAPSSSSSPGRRIVVAPTATELLEDADSLLTLGEVQIPSDDVAEFLADYYPVLRQNLTVTSPDASVELPEPARPRLEVVARLGATGGTWHWRWQYQVPGQDAVTVHPLAATTSDAAVRDLDEEHRITADVEAAVRTVAAFAQFRLDTLSGRDELDPHQALDAATDLLPLLRAHDDVVVTADEAPFTELDQPPTIAVRATDTEDTDWFDLGVTVSVAGREIPFRPLFTALADGQDRLLLPDGAWMRIDVPALDRLRGLIEEAGRLSDQPGSLRLSRHQASLWGDLEDVADVVEQSQAWQSAVGGLRTLLADDDAAAAALRTPVPATVQATLRDYQERGFSWLAFCHDHGLGGILADDMGLGKTLQTLALLAHAREKQGGAPFLVVAPASVVGNWVAEAARFAPHLDVVALDTTLARADVTVPGLMAGADVVVTSYAIFRLDFASFQEAAWSGLILDEAQFVKNPAAKANECARLLRAPFKLAITGTPMENNLTELWALLAVVAPGLFPSRTRFREDYVRPIEAASRAGADDDARATGGAALARLRRRVRPVLLRRTKEQVAPELPPRQEQELRVDLAPRHRKIYDTHLQRERTRVLGMLDDFDANRMAIFRSLTTLRRMALDASLVDPDRYAGVPSSKLDALFDQLDEVIAEGHRALVFSQFTSYLGLVAQRCAARGIDHAYLDGTTRRRADVVRAFREGDAPLFLISLKAGGFGLNLTEADYVFLLDPWWNPAVEAQAVDRTHRIGQTRNVMVFRMVAAGTIEEKVMALKERKAKLTGAVLGDDEELFSRALEASDIRELFGP